ncbi:hypothetical protein AAG570_002686 [Ranatra chinensis]|uniref:Uncharacterized protein n=1 Tax=Ranatra chinensis TaxID=642074 RepID=A0ABD0Y8D6_9HEMI
MEPAEMEPKRRHSATLPQIQQRCSRLSRPRRLWVTVIGRQQPQPHRFSKRGVYQDAAGAEGIPEESVSKDRAHLVSLRWKSSRRTPTSSPEEECSSSVTVPKSSMTSSHGMERSHLGVAESRGDWSGACHGVASGGGGPPPPPNKHEGRGSRRSD